MYSESERESKRNKIYGERESEREIKRMEKDSWEERKLERKIYIKRERECV